MWKETCAAMRGISLTIVFDWEIVSGEVSSIIAFHSRKYSSLLNLHLIIVMHCMSKLKHSRREKMKIFSIK